jgi:hypothetical protein
MNTQIIYRTAIAVLQGEAPFLAYTDLDAAVHRQVKAFVTKREVSAARRAYEPMLRKRINANGMSVLPVTQAYLDGETNPDLVVAGILPHTQRSVGILRLDEVDDPLFVRYARHLWECGMGGVDRSNVDMGRARARGQISTGITKVDLPVSSALLLQAGA